MTTDEILVLSNDVVPGMGVPVAAPGLRAWGLARGLREHGRSVTIAVNGAIVRRAWTRPVPPALPDDVLLVSPGRVGDLVRTRRPRAVVATNSNHIESLGDLGDTALIYDFFAPKMLELDQEASSPERDAARVRLRSSKVASLRASSAVIINGAKKIDYVDSWLREAFGGQAPIPTSVVNMPLPIRTSDPRPGEVVHAVVTGYIQPWSLPGRWAEAVIPFLADGSLSLHLLVNNHWGGDRGSDPLPQTFHDLLERPNVLRHGSMEFGDFRRFLARCHLSIDLFARNPERELAMVTRTAVALSCGLPVLHVPFTETSEFVREHDAGWLVDSEDLDGIRTALEQATSSPAELAARRAGAEAVGRHLLDPVVATAPLHALLEDLE